MKRNLLLFTVFLSLHVLSLHPSLFPFLPAVPLFSCPTSPSTHPLPQMAFLFVYDSGGKICLKNIWDWCWWREGGQCTACPSSPGVPCAPNYADQCTGQVVGHRVLAPWFLILLGETRAAPQAASSWETRVLQSLAQVISHSSKARCTLGLFPSRCENVSCGRRGILFFCFTWWCKFPFPTGNGWTNTLVQVLGQPGNSLFCLRYKTQIPPSSLQSLLNFWSSARRGVVSYLQPSRKTAAQGKEKQQWKGRRKTVVSSIHVFYADNHERRKLLSQEVSIFSLISSAIILSVSSPLITFEPAGQFQSDLTGRWNFERYQALAGFTVLVPCWAQRAQLPTEGAAHEGCTGPLWAGQDHPVWWHHSRDGRCIGTFLNPKWTLQKEQRVCQVSFGTDASLCRIQNCREHTRLFRKQKKQRKVNPIGTASQKPGMKETLPSSLLKE